MAVVFILLGVMAILEPAVGGLAATILVGWVLIFGGVTHLVAAFWGGGARAGGASRWLGPVSWGVARLGPGRRDETPYNVAVGNEKTKKARDGTGRPAWAAGRNVHFRSASSTPESNGLPGLRTLAETTAP